MFGCSSELTNHGRHVRLLQVLLGSHWCKRYASQTKSVPFGPTRILESIFSIHRVGCLGSIGHCLESGQSRTDPFSSVTSSTHNRNEYTPDCSTSLKSRWIPPLDQKFEILLTGGATTTSGEVIWVFDSGKAILIFASSTIIAKYGYNTEFSSSTKTLRIPVLKEYGSKCTTNLAMLSNATLSLTRQSFKNPLDFVAN